MADIELVIKIPEETYKDIQSHDWKNVGRWYSEEWKAIHNGTPLPKGHGRIIDADYAIKQILSLPKNELSTEDMWAIKILNLVPPIIEADKESEE